MPRKNNNAGQPNRSAQMERRATRREVNDKHKRVLGPGSGSVVRIPAAEQKVSA